MKKNDCVRSVRNDDSTDDAHDRDYTRRGPSRRRQLYPFPVPTPNVHDDLAVMSDDDLSGIYMSLNSQRDELLRRKLDPQRWEEEMAYIQRETKIRAERRMHHKQYNEEINREISKFYEEEARLPEYVPNAGMYWLN